MGGKESKTKGSYQPAKEEGRVQSIQRNKKAKYSQQSVSAPGSTTNLAAASTSRGRHGQTNKDSTEKSPRSKGSSGIAGMFTASSLPEVSSTGIDNDDPKDLTDDDNMEPDIGGYSQILFKKKQPSGNNVKLNTENNSSQSESYSDDSSVSDNSDENNTGDNKTLNERDHSGTNKAHVSDLESDNNETQSKQPITHFSDDKLSSDNVTDDDRSSSDTETEGDINLRESMKSVQSSQLSAGEVMGQLKTQTDTQFQSHNNNSEKSNLNYLEKPHSVTGSKRRRKSKSPEVSAEMSNTSSEGGNEANDESESETSSDDKDFPQNWYNPEQTGLNATELELNSAHKPKKFTVRYTTSDQQVGRESPNESDETNESGVTKAITDVIVKHKERTGSFSKSEEGNERHDHRQGNKILNSQNVQDIKDRKHNLSESLSYTSQSELRNHIKNLSAENLSKSENNIPNTPQRRPSLLEKLKSRRQNKNVVQTPVIATTTFDRSMSVPEMPRLDLQTVESDKKNKTSITDSIVNKFFGSGRRSPKTVTTPTGSINDFDMSQPLELGSLPSSRSTTPRGSLLSFQRGLKRRFSKSKNGDEADETFPMNISEPVLMKSTRDLSKYIPDIQIELDGLSPRTDTSLLNDGFEDNDDNIKRDNSEEEIKGNVVFSENEYALLKPNVGNLNMEATSEHQISIANSNGKVIKTIEEVTVPLSPTDESTEIEQVDPAYVRLRGDYQLDDKYLPDQAHSILQIVHKINEIKNGSISSDNSYGQYVKRKQTDETLKETRGIHIQTDQIGMLPHNNKTTLENTFSKERNENLLVSFKHDSINSDSLNKVEDGFPIYEEIKIENILASSKGRKVNAHELKKEGDDIEPQKYDWNRQGNFSGSEHKTMEKDNNPNKNHTIQTEKVIEYLQKRSSPEQMEVHVSETDSEESAAMQTHVMKVNRSHSFPGPLVQDSLVHQGYSVSSEDINVDIIDKNTSTPSEVNFDAIHWPSTESFQSSENSVFSPYEARVKELSVVPITRLSSYKDFPLNDGIKNKGNEIINKRNFKYKSVDLSNQEQSVILEVPTVGINRQGSFSSKEGSGTLKASSEFSPPKASSDDHNKNTDMKSASDDETTINSEQDNSSELPVVEMKEHHVFDFPKQILPKGLNFSKQPYYCDEKDIEQSYVEKWVSEVNSYQTNDMAKVDTVTTTDENKDNFSRQISSSNFGDDEKTSDGRSGSVESLPSVVEMNTLTSEKTSDTKSLSQAQTPVNSQKTAEETLYAPVSVTSSINTFKDFKYIKKEDGRVSFVNMPQSLMEYYETESEQTKQLRLRGNMSMPDLRKFQEHDTFSENSSRSSSSNLQPSSVIHKNSNKKTSTTEEDKASTGKPVQLKNAEDILKYSMVKDGEKAPKKGLHARSVSEALQTWLNWGSTRIQKSFHGVSQKLRKGSTKSDLENRQDFQKGAIDSNAETVFTGHTITESAEGHLWQGQGRMKRAVSNIEVFSGASFQSDDESDSEINDKNQISKDNKHDSLSDDGQISSSQLETVSDSELEIQGGTKIDGRQTVKRKKLQVVEKTPDGRYMFDPTSPRRVEMRRKGGLPPPRPSSMPLRRKMKLEVDQTQRSPLKNQRSLPLGYKKSGITKRESFRDDSSTSSNEAFHHNNKPKSVRDDSSISSDETFQQQNEPKSTPKKTEENVESEIVPSPRGMKSRQTNERQIPPRPASLPIRRKNISLPPRTPTNIEQKENNKISSPSKDNFSITKSKLQKSESHDSNLSVNTVNTVVKSSNFKDKPPQRPESLPIKRKFMSDTQVIEVGEKKAELTKDNTNIGKEIKRDSLSSESSDSSKSNNSSLSDHKVVTKQEENKQKIPPPRPGSLPTKRKTISVEPGTSVIEKDFTKSEPSNIKRSVITMEKNNISKQAEGDSSSSSDSEESISKDGKNKQKEEKPDYNSDSASEDTFHLRKAVPPIPPPRRRLMKQKSIMSQSGADEEEFDEHVKFQIGSIASEGSKASFSDISPSGEDTKNKEEKIGDNVIQSEFTEQIVHEYDEIVEDKAKRSASRENSERSENVIEKKQEKCPTAEPNKDNSNKEEVISEIDVVVSQVKPKRPESGPNRKSMNKQMTQNDKVKIPKRPERGSKKNYMNLHICNDKTAKKNVSKLQSETHSDPEPSNNLHSDRDSDEIMNLKKTDRFEKPEKPKSVPSKKVNKKIKDSLRRKPEVISNISDIERQPPDGMSHEYDEVPATTITTKLRTKVVKQRKSKKEDDPLSILSVPVLERPHNRIPLRLKRKYPDYFIIPDDLDNSDSDSLSDSQNMEGYHQAGIFEHVAKMSRIVDIPADSGSATYNIPPVRIRCTVIGAGSRMNQQPDASHTDEIQPQQAVMTLRMPPKKTSLADRDLFGPKTEMFVADEEGDMCAMGSMDSQTDEDAVTPHVRKRKNKTIHIRRVSPDNDNDIQNVSPQMNDSGCNKENTDTPRESKHKKKKRHRERRRVSDSDESRHRNKHSKHKKHHRRRSRSRERSTKDKTRSRSPEKEEDLPTSARELARKDETQAHVNKSGDNKKEDDRKDHHRDKKDKRQKSRDKDSKRGRSSSHHRRSERKHSHERSFMSDGGVGGRNMRAAPRRSSVSSLPPRNQDLFMLLQNQQLEEQHNMEIKMAAKLLINEAYVSPKSRRKMEELKAKEILDQAYPLAVGKDSARSKHSVANSAQESTSLPPMSPTPPSHTDTEPLHRPHGRRAKQDSPSPRPGSALDILLTKGSLVNNRPEEFNFKSQSRKSYPKNGGGRNIAPISARFMPQPITHRAWTNPQMAGGMEKEMLLKAIRDEMKILQPYGPLKSH